MDTEKCHQMEQRGGEEGETQRGAKEELTLRLSQIKAARRRKMEERQKSNGIGSDVVR